MSELEKDLEALKRVGEIYRDDERLQKCKEILIGNTDENMENDNEKDN
jgi:hypothetical protein